MSSPRLVVRLDIDTIVCMCPGVDSLLSLAKEKGVNFTFFVNMGRAVSYSSTVRNIVKKNKNKDEVIKLPAIVKLGFLGFLKTIILNPQVGKSYPQVLHKIVSEGHDLGLHGGRNHGDWHHNAKSWDYSKVKNEVEWGVNAMTRLGLPTPRFFCSPGFTKPKNIELTLSELGFLALADDHVKGMDAVCPVQGFNYVNTVMLGEPGEVGYVESSMASFLSANDMAKKVKKSFMRGDMVLYDHPCLAGRDGLGRLSAIIETWLELGGTVVPLRELIEA